MIIGYPPPDDEELDMSGANNAPTPIDHADAPSSQRRNPLPTADDTESAADSAHLDRL